MSVRKRNIEELIERHGKIYPPQTLVFKEGEKGNTMFIIHEGEIEIKKRSGRKEKNIAILTKGEFFGEMAMLTGKPRSATAVTRSESILIEISQDQFENVIRSYPHVAIEILRKMAHRLWRTDQILENLLLGDRESQIINVILQLAREAGGEAPGVKVHLDLDELESRVAADAPLIKSILYRLHTLGYIQVKERMIFILRPKKLQQLIDFYEWKEALAKSRSSDVIS